MARSTDSPLAPRVSPPDLPEKFASAVPSRNADLIAVALDLSGMVDLAYASLEQCRVTADAEEVDLIGGTLLDVEMSQLRVASLRLRDAGIRRLRIVGGRIGTLDLSSARVSELELRDVRIDYLNLGAARVDDVEVIGCRIRALDMPQAELTRFRITDTTTDEVDTRGMRARDVDLRGLDALAYLDANSLRGATLTSMQVQQLAPAFAAGLGIQVKD